MYALPNPTNNCYIDGDEQIDFARALLQKLSIGQVIILGASDGGVYAQIFAKRYPELVRSVLFTALNVYTY